MNILYHLTVLPPKIPQAEALSQEIAALRGYFDGELNYINPNQRSPLPLPRVLFGFQQLKWLRRTENQFSLHHFYNPDAFPFPVLRFLRRPVIYTITSGVGEKRPNLAYFSKLAAIAVADERSFKRLRGWGIENVFLVKPGIDTSRFTHTPLPVGAKIRLLVGSAPWTKAQFESKGVTALLEAARQEPRLHLTFLWRGALAEEMNRQVEVLNLDNQVTVINKLVDVNTALATVHAAIALAGREGIIKSYPHSLLDALAAGKPVLVNRAIPMADYVEQTACGVVVENVSAESVLTAVAALTDNYQAMQKIALEKSRQDFSLEAMIASYQDLYHSV